MAAGYGGTLTSTASLASLFSAAAVPRHTLISGKLPTTVAVGDAHSPIAISGNTGGGGARSPTAHYGNTVLRRRIAGHAHQLHHSGSTPASLYRGGGGVCGTLSHCTISIITPKWRRWAATAATNCIIYCNVAAVIHISRMHTVILAWIGNKSHQLHISKADR